ncbi:carboxylesterase family protein [Aurantimonas aggregata]|uniref:Carboxylic ester hydrolase n=1 Tax=Aurantimonas aggregata TaxID=2047720 RepID=A0A6L9MC04_9HYPH|nr:carboxylesterase family protein [Aurantimonas aggregata]NDV85190.1 carboxylesterase family protein [Aurantimonas aggregata]
MPETLRVEAPCGPVSGIVKDGIARFLGIPYAEPPLGMARFARPRPRRAFDTVFVANKYGPAAPQRRAMPEPLGRIAGTTSTFQEDCLNLHVWTPDINGKQPVLVFIHGGAFIIGSGAQYPGDDLARRGDIVVVTMNYRLGFFGFNAFAEIFEGDDRFAANAGLLDQRLALEWVRNNIAAFGGDPERVTIAGESAGAASVAFHLVSEASRGLFSQAVIQSGTLNMFQPRQTAEAVHREAVKALLPNGDRERLFRMSHGTFSAATRPLAARNSGILTRPYCDGVEMPEADLTTLYAAMKKVPMIIGTNRDEFSFFSELPVFPFETEKPAMQAWIAGVAGAEAAERIARLYSSGRDGRIAFGTDLLFRMAAIHQAEIHCRDAPTFMYRLDWETKGLLSRLGATHSADLPLIFEDFLKPFRSVYLGILPDHHRQALADRMRAHWVSFVRDGRPADGWPAYEAEKRETKVFGIRDRVLADPEALRRVAWEGVDGFAP